MAEVRVLTRSIGGHRLVLGVFTEWRLLAAYLAEHRLPVGTMVEPDQEPSQSYWSFERAGFTYTVEQAIVRGGMG